MEILETLGRYAGPRGEVVLRRRTGSGPVVDELIVNGTFAMDSSEIDSERELGEMALDNAAAGSGVRRMLIGGLGLGFTVREILDGADDAMIDVELDVVEIEECLIGWAREGITPTLGRVAADPRVRLYAADVRSALAGLEPGPLGPWDAIVLDVDNGPDFLIHDVNAALYTEVSLSAAYQRLAPGGTLAIWCQGPSPGLLTSLRRCAPNARESTFVVRRGERRFAYVIYAVTRT